MDKPFHTFDFNGKRIRLYYDEAYQTRGSYAYDTEEETKAAEDEETAKLNSGEWVVFGAVVLEPCPCKRTCPNCDGWAKSGSCWGIVADNSTAAIEAAARDLV